MGALWLQVSGTPLPARLNNKTAERVHHATVRTIRPPAYRLNCRASLTRLGTPAVPTRPITSLLVSTLCISIRIHIAGAQAGRRRRGMCGQNLQRGTTHPSEAGFSLLFQVAQKPSIITIFNSQPGVIYRPIILGGNPFILQLNPGA